MSRTCPCWHESIFDEGGIPDQMIIVVRDMFHDPYASLPPQGVQKKVFFTYPFLVTHPVITPVQWSLTSSNKRKPRSHLGVSHAALYYTVPTVDWFFQNITSDIVYNVGVWLEDGYQWSTVVCVFRNLPFTPGYSALIFTQALIKGKCLTPFFD